MKEVLFFLFICALASAENGMRPYQLEDPMAHPEQCGFKNKGLICDPKRLLDEKQRQDIEYALFSVGQNAQLFQDSCPIDPLYPRVFVVDRIVSHHVNESKPATADEMQDFVQFLLRHQLTVVKPELAAQFANCTVKFANPVILYSFNDSKLVVGLNVSRDITVDGVGVPAYRDPTSNKEVFFSHGESPESAIKQALLLIANEHRGSHRVPPLRSVFVPLGATKIRQGVWQGKHECLISKSGAEVCDLGKLMTMKEHERVLQAFDELIVNTSRKSSIDCIAAPVKPFVYLVRKVPTVNGQDYGRDDIEQYANSFARQNDIDRCGKHVLIVATSEDYAYNQSHPNTLTPRAFYIKGGVNTFVDSLHLLESINRENTRNIKNHNFGDALIHIANVLSREHNYKLTHGSTIVNVTVEQATAAPPTAPPKAASAVGDPTRDADYEKCGNDVDSRLCDVDRYLSQDNRTDLIRWYQRVVDETSKGASCRDQPILPYIYLVNKIPSTSSLYASQAEMTKYAQDIRASIDTKSQCGKEFLLVFSTANKDYGLATGANLNRAAMSDIVQGAMKMFIEDGNWLSGLQYIAYETKQNYKLLWDLQQ